MWTFFAGMGGKVAAIGAAALAALGALAMVRKSGIDAQQNADLKEREKDRGKAEQAAADVARLDDATADRELHQQYDRK